MNEIKLPGKIYQVGGSVRDRVMGKPNSDLDYVVVGATAEDMINAGFKQVGKDFPVYLHPITGDEYALARLERKTGNGYHGFETITGNNVTLEDDLSRRDLTMNAMASDEDGNIIDPFGGLTDIKNKELKHVSPAFAEDPLRILRVARFAARFGFGIHPDTLKLMQNIHNSGETQYLTKERIWKETERALLHDSSSIYWTTLDKVGMKESLFPYLLSGDSIELNQFDNLFNQQQSDLTSRIIHWSLPVNINSSAKTEELMSMWNEMSITKEIRDRLLLSCNFWNIFHNTDEQERLNPGTLWYKAIIDQDGLRRSDRLLSSYNDTLNQISFIAGKKDFLPNVETVSSWISILKIDAASIAKNGDPKTVKERVEQARFEAWKSLKEKKKFNPGF